MIISQLKRFLWASLCFVLIACGGSPIFDKSHSFQQQKWSEDEAVVFEVEVEDTVTPYDFVITLRTTTSYAYSNLWLFISSTAPDGITSKVAQRINIARGDGSWIGSVSGSVVESKLTYKTQSIPYKGSYTFKIELATQQPEIREILDISMRVERHTSNS
jgi:gliding motility-associated lipoprotein GldH